MLLSLYFLLVVATVQALNWKGVDWSSTLIEEAAGKTYKNAAGFTQAIETILKDSGVNTVRQRVWVNPSGGDYNLAYNVKLAERAHAASLGILLDLHLSDTWADPGHQATPSGWPSDISDLAWETYNYTLAVCDIFAAHSIPISMIAIGNEITGGLLWPLGGTSSYYNIPAPPLRFIRYQGLNAEDQAQDHDPSRQRLGLGNAKGPLTLSDFDIMAVSYYPFYNPSATLANLKSSLTNMAAAWGKSLVVAETDWPVSCPSPKYAFPSDARSLPYSAAGQTMWMKDVASVVSSVKGGAGVFYWEPDWVQNANLGSSCADCLMVDPSGRARSSLSVFSSI